MEKKEKRERNILTPNRLATITKRETSLEGLASQFENGEDGIYDLIVENNKNVLFTPKIAITPKDIEEIPELLQAKDAISYWEQRLPHASGKEAFIIKKAIIDFRRDQYLIKNQIKVPVQIKDLINIKNESKLEGYVTFNDKGRCVPHGITFIDPVVCGAILREYNTLKSYADNHFSSELGSFIYDFDNLRARAMQDLPIYSKVIECKLAGMQNIEIQKELNKSFNINYSSEYISNIWRKKIPKVIASKAEDEYLDWYYLEVEKGQYKKCGRCGKVKLAHSKYYCRNKNSKDGWYSICKECRSTKNK